MFKKHASVVWTTLGLGSMEDVITGLEFLVDLPMWSLVGQQDWKERLRYMGMMHKIARAAVLNGSFPGHFQHVATVCIDGLTRLLGSEVPFRMFWKWLWRKMAWHCRPHYKGKHIPCMVSSFGLFSSFNYPFPDLPFGHRSSLCIQQQW